MGLKQKYEKLKRKYRNISGKLERGLVGKKQYVYYCP